MVGSSEAFIDLARCRALRLMSMQVRLLRLRTERKLRDLWMSEQQLEFGMAVGPLCAGALAVDGLVERSRAIEGDTHLGPGFPVEVFDTALALCELLVLTTLSVGLREEQGAAKALRAVAIGMGELVGGMHAQSDGA